METLIEQPVVDVEKILIYENKEEISKIIQDARIRCSVLNEVISAGVPVNQIKDLNSEKAIENFVFQEHLKLNKYMAQQYSAGMRQTALVENFNLPDNLENMQRKLLQWLNFPIHRGGDKYRHLQFIEGKFELDSGALEIEFGLRKLKFYILGDDIAEYKKLESMLGYFQDHNCPNNQIGGSSFFNDRFESVGQFKYKVRWTYFRRD